MQCNKHKHVFVLDFGGLCLFVFALTKAELNTHWDVFVSEHIKVCLIYKEKNEIAPNLMPHTIKQMAMN